LLTAGGGTPVLIGYARVSTENQHLDLQRDGLERAGCERTFEDRRSGAKIDRLGRSLSDLIALVRRMERGRRPTPFADRGHRHLDPERAAHLPPLRRTGRVRAGAGARAHPGRPGRRRARGRKGGRKHRLTPERRAHAVELYRARDRTVREICRLMGISKPTLYAYVTEAEARS
jgi:DNA invertase Pin-like site-specific DNA recombinase